MTTPPEKPPTVTLDPADPLPPYEQIRRQIAAWIAAQRLPAGTPLPSVRQLAGDLDVAPNTVMRAYSELEGDGWIVSVSRKGFRVASAAAMPGKQECLERVRSSVAELLNLALHMGLDVRKVRVEFERQAQRIENSSSVQKSGDSGQ